MKLTITENGKNNKTVKNLCDLRKRSVKQIATTLMYNVPCDPDVAKIAAWYVYHNKPPKNWSRVSNVGLQIDIITMPKKFMNYIMKNYEYNKLNQHNHRSLLPVKIISE